MPANTQPWAYSFQVSLLMTLAQENCWHFVACTQETLGLYLDTYNEISEYYEGILKVWYET